ncbi:phosphoserine phosphatase [Saccharospirillum sp. MSK14-1]|uniref:histidinol-phosphatase n=1 Tax=Saccharospirillum sp. MSK14-1 TaxID=1897632 RepID=UPI000D351CA4|nr:HAD family hydrolase [Saccharospirillum sp. MSK14-1]PTY38839.1 phosphoserine phosphatase [Saccharospirillum sp. MSK14-1]
MTLAIFDLDQTLLTGDSDHAWGEFLVESGLVDAETVLTANDQFFADYQAGRLDIQAYLLFVLEFLAHKDPAELAELHRRFMDAKIIPMIQAGTQALLDKHRDLGHTLMIITATNRFVTGPIAQYLGIEHLIACEAEQVNGRYTGRPEGVPSFREGKVTRLEAWLKEHAETLDGAWFYSDSHNDLPLLSLVDHPVAVDPDARLQAEAEQRGWSIISLRETHAEF